MLDSAPAIGTITTTEAVKRQVECVLSILECVLSILLHLASNAGNAGNVLSKRQIECVLSICQIECVLSVLLLYHTQTSGHTCVLDLSGALLCSRRA